MLLQLGKKPFVPGAAVAPIIFLTCRINSRKAASAQARQQGQDDEAEQWKDVLHLIASLSDRAATVAQPAEVARLPQ
jgi:hypothetical protein